MIRILLGLTLGLAATGVMAADLQLTVQNNTATTVTSLSAYGTDGNGQPVEDNLAFAQITIAPGSSGTLTFPGLTTCGEIWLRAQDAADQEVATGPVDLCQSTTVALTD